VEAVLKLLPLVPVKFQLIILLLLFVEPTDRSNTCVRPAADRLI
jgi:hypothetical protein